MHMKMNEIKKPVEAFTPPNSFLQFMQNCQSVIPVSDRMIRQQWEEKESKIEYFSFEINR